jgi:hypothetical protein
MCIASIVWLLWVVFDNSDYLFWLPLRYFHASFLVEGDHCPYERSIALFLSSQNSCSDCQLSISCIVIWWPFYNFFVGGYLLEIYETVSAVQFYLAVFFFFNMDSGPGSALIVTGWFVSAYHPLTKRNGLWACSLQAVNVKFYQWVLTSFIEVVCACGEWHVINMVWFQSPLQLWHAPVLQKGCFLENVFFLLCFTSLIKHAFFLHVK